MRELGASNKRTEDQQREKMGMQRVTGERSASWWKKDRGETVGRGAEEKMKRGEAGGSGIQAKL